MARGDEVTGAVRVVVVCLAGLGIVVRRRRGGAAEAGQLGHGAPRGEERGGDEADPEEEVTARIRTRVDPSRAGEEDPEVRQAPEEGEGELFFILHPTDQQKLLPLKGVGRSVLLQR